MTLTAALYEYTSHDILAADVALRAQMGISKLTKSHPSALGEQSMGGWIFCLHAFALGVCVPINVWALLDPVARTSLWCACHTLGGLTSS